MTGKLDSKMTAVELRPDYRPDIDGLRALSIIAVVIFHAFPQTLAGGFVGVDIFFVISGFLISTIIFKGLNRGSFSFIDFYIHRIRRIFPALLIVLIFCYAIGWFILFPDEFAQLGKHIAAGSGFIQNFILWQEAGYFDNSSDLKPIMHLWSLAVEEQFYLVYPVIIWIAFLLRINFLFVIFSFICISFSFNIYETQTKSGLAFFLPHTRFWELLVGGAIAYFYVFSKSHPKTELITQSTLSRRSAAHELTIKNATSTLGFSLIIFSYLVIKKEFLFPGYWATLPILGGALLIFSGPNALINKYILSNRIMVWIGLISYPLYLWHWPLLSFLRIIESETPSTTTRVIVVVISIFLAWLTYIFIEKPVRYGKHSKYYILLIVVLLISIGTLGYFTNKHNGFESRGDFKSLKLINDDLQTQGWYAVSPDCTIRDAKDRGLSWCSTTRPNAPNFIMWGDSHAEHLMAGLSRSDVERSWFIVGRESCAPSIGVRSYTGFSNPDICMNANKAVIEAIKENNTASVVALASLGPLYIEDRGFAEAHKEISDRNENTKFHTEYISLKLNKKEAFYLGLKDAVDEILRSGKKVILIKDVPEFSKHPKACLKRPFFKQGSSCSITYQDYLERTKSYSEILAKVASSSTDIYIFDAAESFCTETECYSSDEDRIYFRDSHHLSLSGSDRVAASLIRFMSDNKLN